MAGDGSPGGYMQAKKVAVVPEDTGLDIHTRRLPIVPNIPVLISMLLFEVL